MDEYGWKYTWIAKYFKKIQTTKEYDESQNIMLNTLSKFLNYGLVCVTSPPSFVEYAMSVAVTSCSVQAVHKPGLIFWNGTRDTEVLDNIYEKWYWIYSACLELKVQKLFMLH